MSSAPGAGRGAGQSAGRRAERRELSLWRRVRKRVVEAIVFLGASAFVFFALRGEFPVSSGIREYLIQNAQRETGALNLVTSIYLGFRAFDTLGETIVLLLAVSAVLFFVGHDS